MLNAVAFTNLPLESFSLSYFADLSLCKLGSWMQNAFRSLFQSVGERMDFIFRLGRIFKIIDVVDFLVAVDVIDMQARRAWPHKGCKNDGMDRVAASLALIKKRHTAVSDLGNFGMKHSSEARAPSSLYAFYVSEIRDCVKLFMAYHWLPFHTAPLLSSVPQSRQ